MTPAELARKQRDEQLNTLAENLLQKDPELSALNATNPRIAFRRALRQADAQLAGRASPAATPAPLPIVVSRSHGPFYGAPVRLAQTQFITSSGEVLQGRGLVTLVRRYDGPAAQLLKADNSEKPK